MNQPNPKTISRSKSDLLDLALAIIVLTVVVFDCIVESVGVSCYTGWL
jgi:hypothetical protein